MSVLKPGGIWRSESITGEPPKVRGQWLTFCASLQGFPCRQFAHSSSFYLPVPEWPPPIPFRQILIPNRQKNCQRVAQFKLCLITFLVKPPRHQLWSFAPHACICCLKKVPVMSSWWSSPIFQVQMGKHILIHLSSPFIPENWRSAEKLREIFENGVVAGRYQVRTSFVRSGQPTYKTGSPATVVDLPMSLLKPGGGCAFNPKACH